jgi:hypothetical protein
MDASSIKLILPPIKSIGITTCALGKFPHTQKEEEKKEKTEFHPPYSQNKNKKLGSSYLSSQRPYHPSQGSFVPLHCCISAPFSGLLCAFSLVHQG